MIYLRKFTEHGLAMFKEFLEKERDAPTGQMPLEGLLLHSDVSEDIPGVPEVDLSESVLPLGINWYDLSKQLALSLQTPSHQSALIDCPLAAAFLVAARFDIFAKRRSTSEWDLKEDSKYLLDIGSFGRFIRHPVAKFALYLSSPVSSIVCLSTKTYEHPDIIEQTASRQSIIINPSIMELLYKLYWDEQSSTIKPGVLDASKPLSDGCLRRLVGKHGFFAQHELHYNFTTMNVDEILDLLPLEFDGYKS